MEKGVDTAEGTAKALAKAIAGRLVALISPGIASAQKDKEVLKALLDIGSVVRIRPLPVRSSVVTGWYYGLVEWLAKNELGDAADLPAILEALGDGVARQYIGKDTPLVAKSYARIAGRVSKAWLARQDTQQLARLRSGLQISLDRNLLDVEAEVPVTLAMSLLDQAQPLRQQAPLQNSGLSNIAAVEQNIGELVHQAKEGRCTAQAIALAFQAIQLDMERGVIPQAEAPRAMDWFDTLIRLLLNVDIQEITAAAIGDILTSLTSDQGRVLAGNPEAIGAVFGTTAIWMLRDDRVLASCDNALTQGLLHAFHQGEAFGVDLADSVRALIDALNKRAQDSTKTLPVTPVARIRANGDRPKPTVPDVRGTPASKPAAAASDSAVVPALPALPTSTEPQSDPLRKAVDESKAALESHVATGGPSALFKLLSPWFLLVTRVSPHRPQQEVAAAAQQQRDKTLQAWREGYARFATAKWSPHPAAMLSEALTGMLQWQLDTGDALPRAFEQVAAILVDSGAQITESVEVAECFSGLGSCLQANLRVKDKPQMTAAFGVLMSLVSKGVLTGQLRVYRYLGRVLAGMATALDCGCISANQAAVKSTFDTVFGLIDTHRDFLERYYPAQLTSLHDGVLAAERHGLGSPALAKAKEVLNGLGVIASSAAQGPALKDAAARSVAIAAAGTPTETRPRAIAPGRPTPTVRAQPKGAAAKPAVVNPASQASARKPGDGRTTRK